MTNDIYDHEISSPQFPHMDMLWTFPRLRRPFILSTADLIAIIGVAVAIVGILIGYLLSRRGRQKPDLRSAIDFARIVSPADWLLTGGLDLSFRGESIDQVSRSYVAIWNHRGDTVKQSDEVSSDPLRLRLSDEDSVLQSRVVARSRQQIGVSVEVDESSPNVALINFDFLDSGDGAVLEILHHSSTRPRILGTVRGATMKPAKKTYLGRRVRTLMRTPRGKRLLRAALSIKGILSVGYLLAMGAVLYFVVIAPASLTARPPRTVPAENFNLKTIAGQIAYADKVESVSKVEPTGPVLLLSIVLVILGLVALIWMMRDRNFPAIPKSIVREELDGEADKSSLTVGGPFYFVINALDPD